MLPLNRRGEASTFLRVVLNLFHLKLADEH